MSSMTKQALTSNVDDDQSLEADSILYTEDTHSQFLQGSNLGVFSGCQESVQDNGHITCVGIMGVITNNDDIYCSEELRDILKAYSGKHIVSGRSELEVSAKWDLKVNAIAEQFTVAFHQIEELVSQSEFGKVSMWHFDTGKDARALAAGHSEIKILSTAPAHPDYRPTSIPARSETVLEEQSVAVTRGRKPEREVWVPEGNEGEVQWLKLRKE